MVFSTKPISTAIVANSDLIAYALQTLLKSQNYIVRLYPHLDDYLARDFSDEIIFLFHANEDETTVKNNLLKISSTYKKLRPIVLSNRCDPNYMASVLDSGAHGFFCLSDNICQRILLTLQENRNSTLWLSPTAQKALTELHHYKALRFTRYQKHVLNLMLEFKTAPQIAEELNRSTAAIYQVQRYLRALLDVETNNELINKIHSVGFEFVEFSKI